MTIAAIAIQEKLRQFMGEEYADNQYCLLEILRFFGRHPSTRFSRLAIVHALSGGKSQIERVLAYLANKGLIKANIENDILFYQLTENNSLRSFVLEIAALDRHQWQIVLGQTYLSSLE